MPYKLSDNPDRPRCRKCGGDHFAYKGWDRGKRRIQCVDCKTIRYLEYDSLRRKSAREMQINGQTVSCLGCGGTLFTRRGKVRGRERIRCAECHRVRYLEVYSESALRRAQARQKPPACVEETVFRDWLEMARLSRVPAQGFCADCNPEFATRMRAKGRCSNPRIKFKGDTRA